MTTPKRPYQKLPPESERPLGPSGQPLSASEMYAQHRTEKLPPPEPLPMEKVSELRKRVADIQAEMGPLQTNVKLLPDDHPLRRQAQMRLELLTANLEKASTQLKAAEAEAVAPATANELRRLNSTLEAALRDLNARLRSVEQRTIATPAEITDAAKELTAGLKRLTDLEGRFDATLKDATERQQKVGAPEPETAPRGFSIVANYSVATGRLSGFTVHDPEGHTARKRKEYSDLIAKEYREVTRDQLDKAEVHHGEYTVVFVLKESTPRVKEQWWTIDTGNGMPIAIGSAFEPPATAIKRFWEVYHSSDVHAEAEFLQMKQDVLARAEKRQLTVKPQREENLDRYLYAFYKTQSPGILEWFFKTFFEE